MESSEGGYHGSIRSDDPHNGDNIKIIKEFEHYEPERTDQMAESLFRLYSKNTTSPVTPDTVIMTYNLSAIHARRVAAKLRLKEVPEEAICCSIIEPINHGFSTPSMDIILSTRLRCDEAYRSYLDTLVVNVVRTTFRLNEAESKMELLTDAASIQRTESESTRCGIEKATKITKISILIRFKS